MGLRGDSRQLAIEKSRGLVWCPSTNLYLLGETAEVQDWFAMGKLSLGSDSLLTADGDLLDELRAAYATRQLASEELFHCVTDHAAKLLGLSEVGDLKGGMKADVLALYKTSDDPYLMLLQAQRGDIAWVMREGNIVLRHVESSSENTVLVDDVPFELPDFLWKHYQKCTFFINNLS